MDLSSDLCETVGGPRLGRLQVRLLYQASDLNWILNLVPQGEWTITYHNRSLKKPHLWLELDI